MPVPNIRLSLLSSALLFSFTFPTHAADPGGGSSGGFWPQVIYGEDGRQDLYQVQNPRMRQFAQSTVALFEAGDVDIPAGSTQARLKTRSYGEANNLCADEPYRDQQAGAFCSGSLVAQDLIMTAGHCVTDERACKGIKFVFGFGIGSAGADPTSVPASEVYGCGQLVGRRQDGETGPDYAIVRLDRPVANHAPLKLNRSGAIANGTKLFVIGHPSGLPTKVAGGAQVRDADKNGYFVANLDTYGGNSGSAVFNAVTGQIEGILVRGERDFVYDSEKACMRSNRVPDDGGRGEDVTKVSEVLALVPELGPRYAFTNAPGPAYSALLAGDLKDW
jgi:hypothetical protein